MPHLSIARHQSIFDPTKHNPPIHLIGTGATGSRIWLSLVELGLTNLHAYDFDVVEPHNLANQLFLDKHVGLPKVEALADFYKLKTGRDPLPTMFFNNVRVSPESHKPEQFSGVIFLLTDTMSSRREIANSFILNNPLSALMVETRMASSYGNVFVVNPFDKTQTNAWLKTLVDDKDAEVSACGTSISVAPTAAIIANLAVWQFIHALTCEPAIEFQTNIFLKPFTMGQQTVGHYHG